MKTLFSKNAEANIFGKTYKELEKKYVAATSSMRVKTAKCVLVENFCGIKQGAVLGYDNNGKVVCANTFATYCGNEMIICVKVHKHDYLINDAIAITKKSQKTKVVTDFKVGTVTYIDNTK